MKQTFFIDLLLYNQVVLNQGIADFGEVCHISLKGNILEVSGVNKKDIIENFNEYMNYCLGLINE